MRCWIEMKDECVEQKMHELPCFHMQSAKVNFLSKQSAGGVLLR